MYSDLIKKFNLQDLDECEDHYPDCEFASALPNEESVPDLSVADDQAKDFERSTNILSSLQKISKPTLVDNGTQVKSGDLCYSFFNSMIKDNSDLVTFCNIKNFAIFNELTQIFDTYYPSKRTEL